MRPGAGFLINARGSLFSKLKLRPQTSSILMQWMRRQCDPKFRKRQAFKGGNAVSKGVHVLVSWDWVNREQSKRISETIGQFLRAKT